MEMGDMRREGRRGDNADVSALHVNEIHGWRPHRSRGSNCSERSHASCMRGHVYLSSSWTPSTKRIPRQGAHRREVCTALDRRKAVLECFFVSAIEVGKVRSGRRPRTNGAMLWMSKLSQMRRLRRASGKRSATRACAR